MRSPLELKGRRALITGPTSGIGLDLARLFARDGADLVLVSRDAAKLSRLARELADAHGVRADFFASDLSMPGAADRLVRDVTAAGFAIDVLVNNAGFGVYGNFADEDIAAQLAMIRLHAEAPTALAHAFLPHMIRRGNGGILNVASTGAFQPVPIENVYCATKAYLLHFSEALAEELKATGVRVTCLCPGPTETPFFSTPLMKSTAPAKLARMSSPDVARIGFDAFKKGRPFVITGLRNRLMVGAIRLAPRAVVTRIARKVVEKTFSRPC